MAPLDLARLTNIDFIGSLTGNRLAFRLLQSPELVEIDKVDYLVTRDIWGLADPDPRSFPERLIECFQFTGNLFYQDVKVAAFQADWIYRYPQTEGQFFSNAPVSQELAWSAWLLADAARQAINEKDSQNVQVKLPVLPTVIAFSWKSHMANILLEREQTLVDALLLRFRNITELAPLPEGNESKEATAAQTFQLKVETAGLVSSHSPLILRSLLYVTITITNSTKIHAAEDLMSLTRELKEMWLFGPLRSLNEGEARANAQIGEDATAVANLIDSLTKKNEDQEKPTEEKEDEDQAGKEKEDEPKV
jgi:hypothetical protein